MPIDNLAITCQGGAATVHGQVETQVNREKLEGLQGMVEDEKITNYRLNAKISFVVEDE